MGSLLSSPKTPAPPPVIEPPKPPPEAPTPVDDKVIEARDEARRRAAAKTGYTGTILTGELSQPTTGKTILGN